MSITRFHDLPVGQTFTWDYATNAPRFTKTDGEHYTDAAGSRWLVGSQNAHAILIKDTSY